MAERKLDHDRAVALEQLPAELRPAFSALWNLDLAFADVVATSSDPRLGAIRLAWWRERLEELDGGRDAPAEPRLQAVARELLPRGIKGRFLSGLEDGWLPLLEPFPWSEPQAEALKLRGRRLFDVGARLLGNDQDVAGAGALWSIVDGAHHVSDPASRALLLEHARVALGDLPVRVPRRFRALTLLGALAAADVIHQGKARRRGSAALVHRLFGTFP